MSKNKSETTHIGATRLVSPLTRSVLAGVASGLVVFSALWYVSAAKVHTKSIKTGLSGATSETIADDAQVSEAAVTSVSIADFGEAPPAGSVFVAPTGNDVAAGTQGAPKKTVGAAIGAVAAGGTVVMRAGSYHESLASISKKITLQPFPHEQAWFDGAKATSGWTAAGSAWSLGGWTTTLCGVGCAPQTGLIDPAYPMAGSPQMVYYDGSPLAEVANRAAVGAGKFYFAPSAVGSPSGTLYIGNNPAGHVVEATDLPIAAQLNASAAGSRIRYLGFKRYGANQDYSHNPAQLIINHATSTTIEGSTFYQSASTGMTVYAATAQVLNNTFLQNGMNGVNANGADNSVFAGNRIASNNTEHFSTAAGAQAAVAGSKMTSATGMSIRDNIFEDNGGSGWWCDLNCSSCRSWVSVSTLRNAWRPG